MANELTLEQIEAEIARRERSARIQAGADGGGITLNAVEAEIARRTAPRNMPRSSSPTGRRVNAQTQRPATGYELARRRQVAQRPQLAPLGQGARTFNETIDQIPANLGVADEIDAGAAWLGQGAMNLGRHALGRPIEISQQDAARAAGDLRNEQTRRFAREHPELNTVASVAGIPATAGAPVAAAPMSALRAGVTAAGVNAPFALARQEGNLQERLPGAALETGIAFGIGAGGQVLSNALTRNVPQASSRATEFERAGVRPTLAAVNGGASAGATKMIGENFLAGGGVRRALQNSLDDTAAASRRIATQYGQHGQPEQVGEVVQRGVERFARGAEAAPRAGAPEAISTREWSFRSKANALYDRVFRDIARDEAGHLAGQTGARATADATRNVLREIQARVNAPNVAQIVNDPLIGRMANALEADQGALRFNDLRQLRTWVREARARPSLTQTIDEASLARLEGALTEDIYAAATEIGGEAAAAQLRRVDQFYRAGQNRIATALRPFENMDGRSGGRAAYDRILSLARVGGRQNSRALQSLRNSLRPDEWREVAATIIDDMGHVANSNPQALESGAFSVDRFVTNYARLSDDGRRILFGGRGTENLFGELDNLARVAGYQKGVEAMANRSRSGINVQNVGFGAALLNPSSAPSALAGLAGMAITGEMLTNPGFVRWLTSASRSGASVGGARQHLAALARLASRDPALMPLYTDLAQRLGVSPENPQARPRPRREPELQP